MKALEPHSWEKVDSIADMLNARQPWLRKYPGQLLTYLLLEEQPVGIFVLKNKVRGALKYLPMVLDEWLDLGERLLRLCEEVNRHLAEDSEPPVTGYEEAVCGRCRARMVCLPGEAGPGAIPIIEEEMAEALARREELKPLAEEYAEVDGLVKEKAKAAAEVDGDLVCADWLLSVKTVRREMKAQAERTLSHREVRIRRVKGD